MKTRAQELGEAIEKDRAKVGASQEDVAKAVGVTQQAFSGWEAGASLPRAPRLYKLAEFFGKGSATAVHIEHYLPQSYTEHFHTDNMINMSAETHNALRASNENMRRGAMGAKAAKAMGDQSAGQHEPTPPMASDDQDRVEQPHAPYGIKSFEERSHPSVEMRDALQRAANGLRLARQVLDDAADQVDRAIASLPRI